MIPPLESAGGLDNDSHNIAHCTYNSSRLDLSAAILGNDPYPNAHDELAWLSISNDEGNIMISPSLQNKIANARAAALREQPKAMLCANVILSAVDGDEDAVKLAVIQLKRGVGNNWSVVTAIQFMSGRQGGFASDYAPIEEKTRLHLAHIVARLLSNEKGLGPVEPPDGMDMSKLASLVEACKLRLK